MLSHEDEDFKQIVEVHAQTMTNIRTRMHMHARTHVDVS